MTSKACFAGGCFWCIEAAFATLSGVISAVSGYTGGASENPSYTEVCSGATGHLEAVLVTFDPDVVTFDELLDHFWRQIDPTDPGGQFADRGSQYATAIYYFDEEQKSAAEESKKALESSGRLGAPVATPILPAAPFYPAEEYHQDFFRKQPDHYEAYKQGSGRARKVKELWD